MNNILKFFGILFIIFIFSVWGIEIAHIGNINVYKANFEKNTIDSFKFCLQAFEKNGLYLFLVFVCIIFYQNFLRLINAVADKIGDLQELSNKRLIFGKAMQQAQNNRQTSSKKPKFIKLENSKDDMQIFSTENLFLVTCNSFEKMFMNKLNGISFARALYDRYITGAYTYEQYELLKYIFEVRNKIIHNQKHLKDEEYFQYSDFLSNMYQILKDKWDKEDEKRK